MIPQPQQILLELLVQKMYNQTNITIVTDVVEKEHDGKPLFFAETIDGKTIGFRENQYERIPIIYDHKKLYVVFTEG